jgi:hypothetical protein
VAPAAWAACTKTFPASPISQSNKRAGRFSARPFFLPDSCAVSSRPVASRAIHGCRPNLFPESGAASTTHGHPDVSCNARRSQRRWNLSDTLAWRTRGIEESLCKNAPRLVLAVLPYLKSFVSPVYTPNRFLIGVTFGILAGLLEEVGWMGFAYPKLRQQFTFLPAAAILGLLWGLSHAPVIEFLGAASPHAGALPAFFAAFVAAMAAIRVLMAWLYEHTQSVALIHMSSPGSLVVFSPPAVSPLQEALWYTSTPPPSGSWFSCWHAYPCELLN